MAGLLLGFTMPPVARADDESMEDASMQQGAEPAVACAISNVSSYAHSYSRSFVIGWQTSMPAVVGMYYSADGRTWTTVPPGTTGSGTQHYMSLSNLTPMTAYYVRLDARCNNGQRANYFGVHRYEPCFIENISMQTTRTTVVVQWTTTLAADTTLSHKMLYGGPVQTITDSVRTTVHRVEARGLTPDTWYQFYVQSTCTNGETQMWPEQGGEFHTAP